MTNTEKQFLIKEMDLLREELKGDFPDPKNMRRINEIQSLLMTSGKDGSLRVKMGNRRTSPDGLGYLHRR